jgi:hypothetical protein
MLFQTYFGMVLLSMDSLTMNEPGDPVFFQAREKKLNI